MKTAKTCTPNLWQQRSNYVNRQPIKTAKTCTPNRYALTSRQFWRNFGTTLRQLPDTHGTTFGQLTDFRATLGLTSALWVAYGFSSVCTVQSLNWVEKTPITVYCRIGSELGTHPSLQCNAAFNPLRNIQPLGKIE